MAKLSAARLGRRHRLRVLHKSLVRGRLHPVQLAHDGIASVPGVLVFQLKRRPPDYVPRKTKKPLDGRPAKGKAKADGAGYGSALPPEKLPYLVELSPGEVSYVSIL